MSDPRVLVVFGSRDDAGRDDAMLVLENAATPRHKFGCACCLPRSVAAQALGQLFLARARGEIPFFRRVVAAPDDEPAVRAAVAEDVVVSARFRLG